MGWRGQDNRDQDEAREWRERHPRRRYDWFSIILFIVMLSASYSHFALDSVTEPAIATDPSPPDVAR